MTPPEMAAISAPRELADAATPATPGQVLAALASAWATRIGPVASAAPLLLLLAQWALETGRGRSCHCWNLGNVKSVDGDGRDFTFYACDEIFPVDLAKETVAERPQTASIGWVDEARGQAEVRFYPKDAAARFRAFGSLDEGALDWFDEVRVRFAGAWAALLTGDPLAFAAALKREGYFTADEAQYAAGLRALLAEFANLSPDGRHYDLQLPRGIQAALARLGFYGGPIDGALGRMSVSAVERFQKGAGVEVDGVVGKDTRAALASALLAAGAATP